MKSVLLKSALASVAVGAVLLAASNSEASALSKLRGKLGGLCGKGACCEAPACCDEAPVCEKGACCEEKSCCKQRRCRKRDRCRKDRCGLRGLLGGRRCGKGGGCAPACGACAAVEQEPSAFALCSLKCGSRLKDLCGRRCRSKACCEAPSCCPAEEPAAEAEAAAPSASDGQVVETPESNGSSSGRRLGRLLGRLRR